MPRRKYLKTSLLMTVLLVTTVCTTAVQTIVKRETKMKKQNIFWFGIIKVCGG